MDINSLAFVLLAYVFSFGALDDADSAALAERLEAAQTPYEVVSILESVPDDVPRAVAYEHATPLGDGGVRLERLTFPEDPSGFVVDVLEIARFDVPGAMAGETPRHAEVRLSVADLTPVADEVRSEFDLELTGRGLEMELVWAREADGTARLAPFALEVPGYASVRLEGEGRGFEGDPMMAVIERVSLSVGDAGMIEEMIARSARDNGRAVADIRQEAFEELRWLALDGPERLVPLLHVVAAMVQSAAPEKGTVTLDIGAGRDARPLIEMAGQMMIDPDRWIDGLEIRIDHALAPEVADLLPGIDLSGGSARPGDGAFDWGADLATAAADDDPFAITGTYKELLPLAEAGDVAAQFQLGLIFEAGEGVAVDEAVAAEWYRRAAEAGHVLATAIMGDFYYDGIGVPEDLAMAAVWYERAASLGDPWSQVYLAEMLADGVGLPQDVEQARVWVAQALNQPGDHQPDAVALMQRLDAAAVPDKVAK